MAETPTLDGDWRDTRCGHNFEIPNCPYKGCLARELHETLSGTPDPSDFRGRNYIGGYLDAVKAWREKARAVLARARGETP